MRKLLVLLISELVATRRMEVVRCRSMTPSSRCCRRTGLRAVHLLGSGTWRMRMSLRRTHPVDKQATITLVSTTNVSIVTRSNSRCTRLVLNVAPNEVVRLEAWHLNHGGAEATRTAIIRKYGVDVTLLLLYIRLRLKRMLATNHPLPKRCLLTHHLALMLLNTKFTQFF